MTPDKIHSFASHMADEAGKIARAHFCTPLHVENKDDLSPVTIADRTIEQTLRTRIEKERPDDGIIGEEFGNKESKSGYTWVLDPIDGTKSFTIGRPTFGTLIGLCYEETPVFGIIDQPILKERWIGTAGQQTLFNGQPVTCRPQPSLQNSIFGTGSPSQISRDDPKRFERLSSTTRYTVYQGDCYFYGLMTRGFLDLIVEDQLANYDYVALIPIIEGAGGIITDWNGNKKNLSGNEQIIAAGSRDIHAAALALL